MNVELMDVTIGEIAGRSRYNARPDDPNDDLNGLAATINAVGLLQRISLTREDGELKVVAGWRRAKAIRHLVDEGKITGEWSWPAALLDGTPEELIAASIAENTERRQLRAPEEAEAFALLASQGRAIEDIARDFGVTQRHVKGRIKLASLCPEAMELWKADALTIEAARLMSALEPDRQRSLLEEANGHVPPLYVIKQAYESDRIRSDHPAAIYVGREAYVAAGGAIDEYLFGEWDYFLDGDLLERLAKEKLQTNGEAIRNGEGWGELIIEPEWSVAQAYTVDRRRDLLDGETERLAAIKEEREAIWNADSYDDEDPETRKKLAALDLEEEVIDTRALLRAIPTSERRDMAVFVSLDDAGNIEVQRAMVRKTPAEPGAASGKNSGGKRSAGETSRDEGAPAPQQQPEAANPAYAAMADEALENALCQTVRFRPDLALTFLVSSLAQQANDVLHIETSDYYTWDNELIAELAFARGLEEALKIATKAPQEQLLIALAELVGYAMSLEGASPELVSTVFQVAAIREAEVRKHLVEAFDADRWFAKASKDDCVEAIVAIEGRNTCEAKKLPAIRAFAANLATDRAWLPPQIARHLPAQDEKSPEPAPSLAQAMSDAIEADEATKAEEPPPVKPKRGRRPKVVKEDA